MQSHNKKEVGSSLTFQGIQLTRQTEGISYSTLHSVTGTTIVDFVYKLAHMQTQVKSLSLPLGRQQHSEFFCLQRWSVKISIRAAEGWLLYTSYFQTNSVVKEADPNKLKILSGDGPGGKRSGGEQGITAVCSLRGMNE